MGDLGTAWDPVTRTWVRPKGSTSAKPIPSAAEQKKRDDEERAAFERETGQKYGLNSIDAFTKWKAKRRAGTTIGDLLK